MIKSGSREDFLRSVDGERDREEEEMEVDEERFIPPRLKISSQEQDTNIQHFLSVLLSIWNLFGEEILKIDNFKRNNHS